MNATVPGAVYSQKYGGGSGMAATAGWGASMATANARASKMRRMAGFLSLTAAMLSV